MMLKWLKRILLWTAGFLLALWNGYCEAGNVYAQQNMSSFLDYYLKGAAGSR